MNALDNIVELVEESQTTTDAIQPSTAPADPTTESPATTNADNVTAATESAEGILLITLM